MISLKDEIKEILDKLQKVANCETASRNALMEMKDKDYQLLLDYITNLQKENERLNLELTGYREAILRDDKLLGLKSKIDVAVKYIKLGKTFENKEIETIVKKIQNDLLNILQGSEE